MDSLISCHVLGCSKQATKWFVAKPCLSTKEVKRIKINIDFIFNNFPVHRTGLRLVSVNYGRQTLEGKNRLLQIMIDETIYSQ